MTAAAGLAVAAYGSYYRVGDNGAQAPAFAAVLDTAVALGAPTVRVWPGRRGSAQADADYRRAVVDDSRRIGELAAAAGVTVSYEYHAGTLTDSAESAAGLLESVAHHAVRTLWQPPNGAAAGAAADGLRRVLGWVTNVHVFHWWPDKQRQPLVAGSDRWERYLAILSAWPRAPRVAGVRARRPARGAGRGRRRPATPDRRRLVGSWPCRADRRWCWPCAPGLPDKLFDGGLWTRLEEVCRVPERSPLTALGSPAARSRLAAAEILLTGWGCPPIDAEALERAPALRAVVHAAGSVKGHLTPACWQRGLRVSSAAAANAVPVAEFTVAAILFANKRVFRLQRRYRQVRERRDWSAEEPGLGNYGRVVGIIGASRVGRLVVRLLQAHDLRLLVADPHLSEADAGALGVERAELHDLLSRADVVSVHAPLLPETRGLLDRRRLALLRDGATLTNTARGAIVDGRALTDELVSGRIEAVIDTTDPEPLPGDSPLYDLPNVLLTPHIAGSLGTETRRMAALAVEEVERFAAGLPFAHGVTLDDLVRLA